MMVSRHLHAAVEADPCLPAVAARVIGDDMMVVGDAHTHVSAMRIGGARPFDAILVGAEARAVEAEPAIELLVIEEDQPGRSEERRLGKEGVSTCRYRVSPDQ